MIATVSSMSFATANEIVDVRRNITLSDDEIPAKDFYIKISEGGGIKKNLVVKAIRKITVKDSGLKTVGDFKTVVGLLKIIHTEGQIAVAREFKLLPRTDQPMLEQIGIMTGDEIDLSDSFVDNSKPAEAKKKVAELTTPTDEKIVEKSTDTSNGPDARIPAATAVVPTEPAPAPAVKPESVVRDI